MPGQSENVSNGTGQLIGSVVEVGAVDGRRGHWRAIALDGFDLGAHARRVDAEGEVFDDWVDGNPRSSEAPRAALPSSFASTPQRRVHGRPHATR